MTAVKYLTIGLVTDRKIIQHHACHAFDHNYIDAITEVMNSTPMNTLFLPSSGIPNGM